MTSSPQPPSRPSFWLDLAARLGAPIFAATLVACLLSGRLEVLHLVLLGLGAGLIALGRLA